MTAEEILAKYHQMVALTDAEVAAARDNAEQRMIARGALARDATMEMFKAGHMIVSAGTGADGWRHLAWVDFRETIARAVAQLLEPNADADATIHAAALMMCSTRQIDKRADALQ